jgi:predicted RNA-binding protein YlqC (UPF0109 family)
MEIQETLESIIKAIVDTPDQISIETSVTPEGVTNLLISAPESVVGQIIGKEGKIIKSIRTLLNLAFPSVHYNLEIKE